MGYTRLGKYEGAGVEEGKRSYYFSAVAGLNTYSQGVLQTVNTSFNGVDPRTGYTVNGTVAGRVPRDQVRTIRRKLKDQGNQGAGEPLLPVWNAKGEVVAYERSMAPERLKALDRNTHLGEMIGAWAGRQKEETLAQGFNELLVDRLWDNWKQGKADGRRDEYVNLADPDLDDPVLKDTWGLIPAETRRYIRQKFGEDGFMVKDMANNALGYREVSVADA